jgi:hypothetical protein
MNEPFMPSIALRAYELWDAAGRPEGRSEEFWFLAEEEFRKELDRQLGEFAQENEITESAAE